MTRLGGLYQLFVFIFRRGDPEQGRRVNGAACYTAFMEDVSLYIHIPLCKHRCGYCDFITYAGITELIPAYAQAVCREIEWLAAAADEEIPIHTVYFGGGTPSLLDGQSVASILSTIRRAFKLSDAAEVSLEANPGTVSGDSLKQLHGLGINRLSLGMQSADAGELALLERQHGLDDVRQAVNSARNAGFDNLNLDLIYGLPGQRLNTWLASLDMALALQPQHLSLYALTLEAETPMYQKVAVGIMPEPDPDLAADMYDAATEILDQHGFVQYEISNWARQDTLGNPLGCRHNLQYWRMLPYLGIGAAAHGFIHHVRTVNISSPAAYIKRFSERSLADGSSFPKTPASVQVNSLDPETEMNETMIMGLRLVDEGVSASAFERRFQTSLERRYARQMPRLIQLGLLEWVGEKKERLRITKNARLVGNQVFKEFI